MTRHCSRAREALKYLCSAEVGTVSFEYVMVAACIVGAVGAALGGTGPGTVLGSLTAGLTAISIAIIGAV